MATHVSHSPRVFQRSGDGTAHMMRTGRMRVLPESTDARAAAAVEYSVYGMAKCAGAYAAVLGGLDAFVFTAGIGEHSAPVRAALCAKLAWLGVKLDAPANASGGPRISTPDSGVSVWVIATDEELMTGNTRWRSFANSQRCAKARVAGATSNPGHREDRTNIRYEHQC